jgi:hypothetical protein
MKSIGIELEKHGFMGIQIYKDLSGAERIIGGRLHPGPSPEEL